MEASVSLSPLRPYIDHVDLAVIADRGACPARRVYVCVCVLCAAYGRGLLFARPVVVVRRRAFWILFDSFFRSPPPLCAINRRSRYLTANTFRG